MMCVDGTACLYYANDPRSMQSCEAKLLILATISAQCWASPKVSISATNSFLTKAE